MTNPDAPSEKQYLFDNPKNVRRVILGLYIACAIAFAADFFIDRHVEHPWESLFGFYGVYGFITFTILVLGAKEMRKIVMRKEDYYDK